MGNTSVKAFFDQKAPEWDARCKPVPHKISAIVTLAQVRSGSRVLDIACGTGVLFSELLSREPQEIVGVDLSEKMIEIAGSKYMDSRINLYVGDFLDYDGHGFDVAVIYSAYPHFTDREGLIRQVYRCLVPGGRFIVAHSEGRDVINQRHHKPEVQDVSDRLRPVAEEITLWSQLFRIDLAADNEDIYFLSGIKPVYSKTDA